jgi:hypothetical protein
MQSWGLEKTLRDWDRDDLAGYLRAAVEKELRLLDREPDVARARAIQPWQWADQERRALMILTSSGDRWRTPRDVSTQEAVEMGLLPRWLLSPSSKYAHDRQRVQKRSSG